MPRVILIKDLVLFVLFCKTTDHVINLRLLAMGIIIY